MPAQKKTAKKRPSAKRATPAKQTAPKKKPAPKKKWSDDVTEHSDAMTLENKVFKGSAGSIARSLKRSSERSQRRKASPYQSAMSMLNFYINRADKNLTAPQKAKLNAAKDELRKLFKKE